MRRRSRAARGVPGTGASALGFCGAVCARERQPHTRQRATYCVAERTKWAVDCGGERTGVAIEGSRGRRSSGDGARRDLFAVHHVGSRRAALTSLVGTSTRAPAPGHSARLPNSCNSMICGTARRACLGAGCGLELGGRGWGRHRRRDSSPVCIPRACVRRRQPRAPRRARPRSTSSAGPHRARRPTRLPTSLSIAFERRVSRAAHPVLWTACLDDDRGYAHKDGAYPGPSGSARSTAAAAYPRRVPHPTARRRIALPRLTRSVP
ncbi:hypothetical protein B0H17DRAFT_1232966 [Mycena rosella]|uniref:Uncharacterized protein n=1 Tax=Mycena rosella TaxID=1033263 RepID=A0AAD7G902_MYCRO|nr:hypothetical protein B0H17DRAFT_1232966 [Mycena rosella]